MDTLWNKLSEETEAEYQLFRDWLDLPIYLRTIQRLAKLSGVASLTIEDLQGRHGWAQRTAAYDEYQMQLAYEGRKNKQEAIREELYSDVPRAIATIRRIMSGKMPRGAETDRKSKKPKVKPDSILTACYGILDRCGVTVPKRHELAGIDGAALKIELREQLENALSPNELAELIGKISESEAPSPPEPAIRAMRGTRSDD